MVMLLMTPNHPNFYILVIFILPRSGSTFYSAIYNVIVGEHRDIKFGTQVYLSNSQIMDEKSSGVVMSRDPF